MQSGRRHYRLKFSDAIEAHNEALEYGGAPGILNEANIRSAIGRPYSGYYRSIHKKAAALVHSVCLNHGFTDGNKRTSVLLLATLLDRSGYHLKPVRGEDLNNALEDLVANVAQRLMDFEDIHDWMTERIKRKPRR